MAPESAGSVVEEFDAGEQVGEVDLTTHGFNKPDGTAVDPCPTQRFRGSALAAGSHRRFSSPAPLAEAENTPFDLGLTLESLAYNQAESLVTLEAARTRWNSRLEYGPPIPTDLARQRIVQAHRDRDDRSAAAERAGLI